ncbi:MAG: hypothetical protein MUF51_10965 [Vicinamibacteria bacterium]|nr:hypothetical protein [Vicinamibacteria bacterium]
MSRKAREVTIVCVVQMDRHLAEQHHRVIDERPAHGRRQEQTDMRLPAQARSETAREVDRLDQRRSEAYGAAQQIGHGQAPRMAASRVDEGALEGGRRRATQFPGVAHQLLHRLAHLDGRRVRRQVLAIADRHRFERALGQLEEEAPTRKAEDAAPYIVDAHRHDRRVDSAHDAFEAAREGQQLADAADLALGEDAHHLTVADGVAGRAQSLDHLARAHGRRDRDGAHPACKGSQPGQLVEVAVHDEADEAIGRGDHQGHIDEREVIAYEQRPALGRDVVAADDAHAVERVREQPEHEAQQSVGQERQGVDRRAECDDTRYQEHVLRREMRDRRGQVVEPGRRDKTHRREEVREGDHAALARLVGAMLDEGVDGHDEEAAEEAEQGEVRQHPRERQARRGERDREGSQAQRPEGDQAVLDLVAREAAGRHAAEADADRERGLQIAGLRVAEVQCLLAEDDDVHLQDQAEEPEIRVAPDRQHQHAVAAHVAPLRRELGQWIQPERAPRISGRDAADAEARDQAADRHGQQDRARDLRPHGERIGHHAGRDRAQDDGRHRAHLDHAVAPRQALLRQQLRQQAVLRRREEGAVCAHQEDAGQEQRQAALRQGEERQAHDEDFEDLHADGDGALAEAIRQPAAEEREQQEWHGEEKAHARDARLVERLREGGHDEERDQPLERVVVPRTQELRHDQRPEAVRLPCIQRSVAGLCCDHGCWTHDAGLLGSFSDQDPDTILGATRPTGAVRRTGL